jgi:hypothetical protein
MIILCLGLPSSASTWAFNIVRALTSTRNSDTLGVYAETSEAFRQKVPPGATNVILKAHVLDEVLFRTIEASDSPTVITWRDPRDASVSIAQRTGQAAVDPISFVGRSAACILSLMQAKRRNMLVLDYSTDYMNRIDTIRDIAKCLQIKPPPALVEKLYKSLKTDTLRKSLSSWSTTLEPQANFNTHVDMDTHWHKDHIGDAKSDKWKDISRDEADLLDACLGGQAAMFCGGQEIRLPWDRQATDFHEQHAVDSFHPISSHSRRAPIHLPRGWWIVEFEATVPSPSDRMFQFSITSAEKLLARRLMMFGDKLTEKVRLVFEHRNPTETIFVQSSGLDDVDHMPISIPTIRFEQVFAPSEANTSDTARRVSKQVIPAS